MVETDFQKKCIEWVETNYWGKLLIVNNHSNGFTNKGFPDLTVFGDKKTIVVELKSDSGYKVQPDQIVWRKRFKEVGTPHYVVDKNDLNHFKHIIRKEFGCESI